MVMKNQSKDKVVVVKASEVSKQTAQSQNLPRVTGVDSLTFWMGRVTGEAGKVSSAHHHGEAETAGYILSGRTRIYFGENYKEYADFGPGDFLYVPPLVPHIEESLSDTEPVVFITSRTKANIVVNLDEKDMSVFSKEYDEIQIVRANELNEAEDQTKPLQRLTGVAGPNLWKGRVVIAPGKASGAHHHGEAQTGGYILSGQMRIDFGENYEEFVELEAGDFFNVPPNLNHIERNMSESEPVVFITSRHPGNIVVNLEN
ncbi:cupin domain-containing protein [Bacillus benzoevorans]|uniref:Putative RmlC-like cupin family protein n=1 Tax=Bacillus benzoevorans TaxID=1456 RepID=A0A7X0HSY2_9BACI|nr:cupin domain-containing protein [Bacillus benzoevorans]MBB6446221.1 putative RmlC-like cupin family protein [Bacillus benzoevorans]